MVRSSVLLLVLGLPSLAMASPYNDTPITVSATATGDWTCGGVTTSETFSLEYTYDGVDTYTAYGRNDTNEADMTTWALPATSSVGADFSVGTDATVYQLDYDAYVYNVVRPVQQEGDRFVALLMQAYDDASLPDERGYPTTSLFNYGAYAYFVAWGTDDNGNSCSGSAYNVTFASGTPIDTDGDGITDDVDVCPAEDATGYDTNSDGCLDDTDGDGVTDDVDLCPAEDATGYDADADGCLDDTDGDGVTDDTDNCLSTANAAQTDTDGDGAGDLCDAAVDSYGWTALNPKATYLHTNGETAANTSPVALSGACGGDEVELTVTGEFNYGSRVADVSTLTTAVFSSSTTLTAASNRYRVTGALDAGTDYTTHATQTGSQPTDISEDFEVTTSGVTVTVPEGTTHLFIAAMDSRYSDNRDLDNDYGYDLSVTHYGDMDQDQACDASADNCVGVQNADQADTDNDGLGDACDACPAETGTGIDADGDGCIDDTDGDGVPDSTDTCPTVSGAAEDVDGDGCFDDDDGDGVANSVDVCPSGDDTVDSDSDGTPDACETSAEVVVTISGTAEYTCYDYGYGGDIYRGTAEHSLVASYTYVSEQPYDYQDLSVGDDVQSLAVWLPSVTLGGADASGAIVHHDYGSESTRYLDARSGTSSTDESLSWWGTASPAYFDDVRHQPTVGTSGSPQFLFHSIDDADHSGHCDYYVELADGETDPNFTTTVTGGEADTDGDGLLDSEDDCPLDADNDLDGDGYCGNVDTCPDEDSTGYDTNADGCLDDGDGDGVTDDSDMCPTESALGYDDDGDGCLDDDDLDGVPNSLDACPEEDATDYDANFDGCIDDTDGDGINDVEDICPLDIGNDADGDGQCSFDGDCDDDNAEAYLGADELVADGIDEDCDGAETCYVDEDGDGVRVDATVGSADSDCDDEGEALATASADDCDDTDANTYPGADEIVGDGIDEDCDGEEFCYADYDGDGARGTEGAETWSEDSDCDDEGEALVSTAATDCDDGDAYTYAGAPEIVGDDKDEDCDNAEECYADADFDHYRTDTTVMSADTDCADAGEAYESTSSGDCDDSSAALHPGATEGVGDEVDQNCDGAELCYADADNDGYRTSSTVASSNLYCTDSGEALASDPSGDCKDSNFAINPGAAEVCDGVDDNCDGAKSLASVCADECGDGSVTTTLASSTAPACTSVTKWTAITTLAKLNAWAANPTTSANISASIAAAGANLELVTNCDVKTTTAGSLTGVGSLAIVARNITLQAPVTATGEVMLRASGKAYLTTAATIAASSFTAESAQVDVRSDNTTGGGFCADGGSVYVGTDTSWNLGGEPASFDATGQLDMYGDLSNGGDVDLAADARLYHRSVSVFTNLGDVTFSSGTVADMAGDLTGVDSVSLDALTLNFAADALWADAGSVDIATSGTVTTTFNGDITDSGDVHVTNPGLFYFTSNSSLLRNANVTLDVLGRFDGRGLIHNNAVVDINSGSWKLTTSHSFTGNTACTISGTRAGGTAPRGCTIQ